MSVLVVDLSSVLIPHYHAHGKRSGGHATSDAAVRSVRELAEQYGDSGVAVCCDCPGVKTWRHEIYQGYKADRDPWDVALVEEDEHAKAELARDWPVFAVPGFEGEDLCATVMAQLWSSGVGFVVVSSDKDLLQTIGPRVYVYRQRRGEKPARMLDAAAVFEEFEVHPNQIRDLLCISGDSSDSIVGIPGVGGTVAVKILSRWGTLEKAFQQAIRCTDAKQFVPVMSQAKFEAFRDGIADAELTRRIVALRKDAPIDCGGVLRRRSA
jgi:DNA polymerase-1